MRRKKLQTTIEIPLCFLCHKPIDTDSMHYHDKQTGAMAHIECYIDNMEDDPPEPPKPKCNHIVGFGRDYKGARLITAKDCEVSNTKRKRKLTIKQEFKYCPLCRKKL